MDHKVTITMVIDTEAKKNNIRNSLKSSLEQQYTNGNLKSWNMDIVGVSIPSEDNESYSSPTEE